MKTGHFQSKHLTRDYQSFFQNRLLILDLMVARRSWRKYRDWSMSTELEDRLKAFIKRSSTLRECPADDLLLVTEKKLLPDIFKAAYTGFAGKINPWLPKSGAAGFLALAIDKEVRHVDRPTAYAFPSMVGQDTVLWLTEQDVGTVWLAGLNGKEMAGVLGLSRDKWIPAMIVFGKTGKGPAGINIDNFIYRSISRKRKPLQEIICRDRYDRAFALPDLKTEGLSSNPSSSVAESLEGLSKWSKKRKAITLTQLNWELLAEAARISPSATNKQPWKFVLVQDPSLLCELGRLLGEHKTLQGAIVCLGEISYSLLEKGLERPFWMIDLPIAVSSITLMAGALDLPAKVYINNIPEQEINSLMKLEAHWRTVGVVGLR